MGELLRPRIGILASGDRASGGGGSTADRFARDVLEGKPELDMDIAVVVCNNPPGTVGVYERFEMINKHFGLKGDDRIDVINISGKTHPGGPQERGQTAEESAAICDLFDERDVSFAAMLGYMKVLTGAYVQEWCWQEAYGQVGDFTYRNGLYHPHARTSNNHPGILPFTADTHGHGTHERAIWLRDHSGLGHTAMTWHLASGAVDQGPIVDELPVDIYGDDTADSLGDRVQTVEKDETVFVIEKHLVLRQEHLHGGA